MDNKPLDLILSSSDDNADLLYETETFVTCRNSSDTFYLCQILHHVYTFTKSIHIQWYSPIDADGDDTKITINTRLKPVYKDKLDPDTILLSIDDIIHHEDDNTVSLKKQHIVDTKRLLLKSIRGESISSDDMMDLSTEHQNRSVKKKIAKHIRFDSSNESDSSPSSESSVLVSSKSKKRKKISEKKKPRKQPVKKRQRTKGSSEISDDDKKPVKPKKKSINFILNIFN